MPQGLELHVLVAQNFSANKKAELLIIVTVKSTYKVAGQRVLRSAEMCFSLEIGVFGVQTQCLLVR